MSIVTVHNAAGIDYTAYIAALKALNGLTVAFTAINHVTTDPEIQGDDTITLSLSGGKSFVLYGEFAGTQVFNGTGPVYGFTVFNGAATELTATWADGHRFALEDLSAALVAGGSALEDLVTTDPITFRGNDGADIMLTGAANDKLNGGDGNDDLSGGGGADQFNGGAGADTMAGGDGNDTYRNPVFGAGGDTIVETETGGNDIVQSNATISLAGVANVERLTLTGSNAIDGTGNTGANTITGNAKSNKLDGGDGNDTLFGGDGADELTGGAGADQLRGGNGNDTYINPILSGTGRDRIFEDAEGGNGDTVLSNASINLSDTPNVERLTLTGNADANGIGNASDNLIAGNGGRNTLNGGVGNDTLDGGAGKDILIGGEGNDSLIGGAAADTFRFAVTNTGTDTITGFETSLDRFDLAGGDFESVTVNNGNTRLVHAGGTIIVKGVAGLTLDQWNALVLPAGGAAAVHEPLGLAVHDAGNGGLSSVLGHFDYIFA